MPSDVRLVVTLHIHPGRDAEFRDFETRAAAIMREYGGRILHVLRPLDAPDTETIPHEIHLVSFPSMERWDAYRADPALEALQPLRKHAIAQTSVVLAEALPGYGSRTAPRRSDGTESREPPTTWYEGFAERYDEWAEHMTADVPFYVGLARQAEGPIVELAVGSGRVAIPVAKATGRLVIGIDSSPAMLQQARLKATHAGVQLDLRAADMRDLTLSEPAGLIYCPFRALLHLHTWADRRRVFERVAASLAPGGRFAWNAFAFDHRVAIRMDGVRQTDPVPHTARYAVGDNRIDLTLEGGGTSSLWWATKNEWLGLLDVAGLRLENLYGGFNGERFTDESSEYVFVARRPRQADAG